MTKYSWNLFYNKIIEIKQVFIKNSTKDPYTFDKTKFSSCVNWWVYELNIDEYTNIFKSVNTTQFGSLILFKYDMIQAITYSDMWINKNSIYREARSVLIDVVSEQLVVCPFKKFFNINEVEENKIENLVSEIKNSKVFEISDKLDCSMQNASVYNGEAILIGSASIDPNNSWRLANGYSKLTENYKTMILHNPTLTFCFENINLEDSNIVNYTKEDEGLYLIGIRNKETGEQYPYSVCKNYAEKYNIKMTSIEKDLTLDDILNLSKELKSHKKEGWVIYIDGRLVKIKCDDYVKLHKIVGKLSSVNVIIQSIADETFDDLFSKIPNAYKKRVTEISSRIFEYKIKTEKQIDEAYNFAMCNCENFTRKDFMIWIDTHVSENIKGYVRSKYLGKPYNVLKKAKDGYKSAGEMGI